MSSRRTLLRLPTVFGFGAVLIFVGAGCSVDEATPKVMAAPNVACDRDVSSDDSRSIVEKVGGLVAEDYRVKFAEGTSLGVVALVDQNLPRAFQELHHDYGVQAVAMHDKDRDAGTVSGFSQVREIVESICGP